MKKIAVIPDFNPEQVFRFVPDDIQSYYQVIVDDPKTGKSMGLACGAYNFTSTAINLEELRIHFPINGKAIQVGYLEYDFYTTLIACLIAQTYNLECVYSLIIDLKHEKGFVTSLTYVLISKNPDMYRVVEFKPDGSFRELNYRIVIPVGTYVLTDHRDIVHQILREENKEFKGFIVLGKECSYAVRYVGDYAVRYVGDIEFKVQYVNINEIIESKKIPITDSEFTRNYYGIGGVYDED